jgi:hypothetical protein
VKDYIIEVSNTAGDVYENAACGTTSVNGEITCTVVGIPNGVAYTARVAAITSAGVGLFSDAAGPLTPAKQTQGVTNLAAVASGSSLVVSYDAPLVTDSAVTGYRIYIAPVGGSFSNSTPINTTNLSETIPVSSITSASVNSASVRSASVNGPTVRLASLRIASVPSSTPSPSASSSGSGGGYQVKVVTITQSGDAIDPNDYVTEGLHIGLTTPSSPRSLSTSLVNGTTSKSVFIAWSTPISDGGSAISGYNVIVDGVTVCAATSSLSCEIPNATDGKNYQISVVAINSLGSSSSASAVHAMPALPVSSGGGAAPAPTVAPTPAPTTPPTPRPTTPPAPRPTQQPTQAPTSAPTAAPTPVPSAAPTPLTPIAPVEPAPGVSVAPQPTEVPNPVDALSPTVEIPQINPGEPVANPAIGATGDDNAPPQEFSPLSSPEGVAAATATATQAVTMISAVAGAVAAAAGAAAAAAAAGAAAGAASASASAASAGSAAGGAVHHQMPDASQMTLAVAMAKAATPMAATTQKSTSFKTT